MIPSQDVFHSGFWHIKNLYKLKISNFQYLNGVKKKFDATKQNKNRIWTHKFDHLATVRWSRRSTYNKKSTFGDEKQTFIILIYIKSLKVCHFYLPMSASTLQETKNISKREKLSTSASTCCEIYSRKAFQIRTMKDEQR